MHSEEQLHLSRQRVEKRRSGGGGGVEGEFSKHAKLWGRIHYLWARFSHFLPFPKHDECVRPAQTPKA